MFWPEVYSGHSSHLRYRIEWEVQFFVSPSNGIGIGALREAVSLAFLDVNVRSQIGAANLFASLFKARVDLNEFVLADLLGRPTALAPVVCVDEVLHFCLSVSSDFGHLVRIVPLQSECLDETV